MKENTIFIIELVIVTLLLALVAIGGVQIIERNATGSNDIINASSTYGN